MIITQQQAWAAAAYAHRLNGGIYYKEVVADNAIVPNKTIVFNELVGGSPNVTDEDRQLGELAFKTISKNLTLAMLADEPLHSFEQKMVSILNTPHWEIIDGSVNNKLEWSCIASQIKQYFSLVDAMAVAKTLEMGYVGAMRDKIQTTIEVMTSNYSQQWNTFFITAVTDSRHLVLFAYKEALTVGAKILVKGAVKAHLRNKQYKTDMTQLTRVKIITQLLLESA